MERQKHWTDSMVCLVQSAHICSPSSSFLVSTNFAKLSVFAQFSLSLQPECVSPFSTDHFHRLWLKPRGWLAVSPPFPSRLQLLIYLLLKVCKKQTRFVQTPWKKQIWVHVYSGIWGKRGGKRGGRGSNMPATFLAANNFGQLQLLYVLLQQNCILTESFSLLQQSVCNRSITWQQAPLGCTGQYTCARSACFQS